MRTRRKITVDSSPSHRVVLRVLMHLGLILVSIWPFSSGFAAAAAPPTAESAASAGTGDPQTGAYHTPLAGEPGRASFLGYPVQIPAVDRSHLSSITLGGSVLNPKQGGTLGVPVVALYLRRIEPEFRTRDTISVFVNELEYDRRFGDLELVGRFENYTLPTAQTELSGNSEIQATSVYWGTLLGALGPGLRIPVAPYQVDNDLRLQLLGCAGYLYARRNDNTGRNLVLPPDTLLYGAQARVRYDTLRRNLLELPHEGFGTGFDVDYLVRDRWRALGVPGALETPNKDYLQVSGYFVGAGPVPGLSERNRLLVSLYGGATPGGRGDRYNAYRINGGPFPSEADDLPRPHYTSLVYDDIFTTDYAIASAGFRRELAFFIYLSLVGSYIWTDRATALSDGRVDFHHVSAASGTASLDFAFFWNSSVNVSYVWDSGAIRNGRSGSGIIVTWNKLL